ncbi:hypothetical protein D1BOALGB6SA_6634 [Olavius sp. associated proteobacterium Delta 1]|nr:hypothetical protein D1BOALGB6SA_6634 [Olavius sp. associated proteobacterium Delta 1]
MSRFDPSRYFNSIVSSQIETWHEWVKEKIDAADFRNRALKFEKTGELEIDLSQMTENVTMD